MQGSDGLIGDLRLFVFRTPFSFQITHWVTVPRAT